MNTKDFKTRTIFTDRPAPYKKGEWVIGLDIGYSSVKGFAPNKIYCFPAFAKQLENLDSFVKAHGESDIRYRDEVNGTWIVGELAYNEVTSEEDMTDEDELIARNRYTSTLYKIITRVGLAFGLMTNSYGSPYENGEEKKLIVQAGLPPQFLSRDSKYVRSAIKGHHKFELMIGKDTQWKQFDFYIDAENVYFIEQPKGALISASVDNRGRQVEMCPTYFNSDLIVFDPGFGTLDDYVVHLGRVTLTNTYPNLSMHAVFRRTCDDIKEKYDKDITVPQLQTYLEKGTIYVSNENSDDNDFVVARKVIHFSDLLEKNCREVCMGAVRKMSEKHNKFENTEYIIATGGTYDAWADYINEVFENLEGLTIVPANINDPSLSNIFSNVRGYYFYRLNAKNG